MADMEKNIIPYRGAVQRIQRELLLQQKSKAFWLTGLSGAGKSTIAHGLEAKMFAEGHLLYVFDGDNVRQGLCRDLGFSQKDRTENIRRIAEMLHLFVDAGIICLAAFISPLKSDRELVRDIVGPKDFFEIFISCPVETCEERDVKGLYKRARAGLIKNYTGISAPYEAPDNPALTIKTEKRDIESCVLQLYDFVKSTCLHACS
jgi:adenylylsulfate kinase